MTFIVFGYGSLVWKPPPHTITKTPAYVKGFIRRYAQSSNDHRGTPSRPGRVVTLVTREDWETLTGEVTPAEEAIVWGVGWEIDPVWEEEVRRELDHREKNGYSIDHTDLYNLDADGNEVVAVKQATIYVGKLDNEAFIGSEPLPVLSARILSCSGPSGENRDYLYKLAESVRALDPDSKDEYLFRLERAVKDLEAAEQASISKSTSLPASEERQGEMTRA